MTINTQTAPITIVLDGPRYRVPTPARTRELVESFQHEGPAASEAKADYWAARVASCEDGILKQQFKLMDYALHAGAALIWRRMYLPGNFLTDDGMMVRGTAIPKSTGYRYITIAENWDFLEGFPIQIGSIKDAIYYIQHKDLPPPIPVEIKEEERKTPERQQATTMSKAASHAKRTFKKIAEEIACGITDPLEAAEQFEVLAQLYLDKAAELRARAKRAA